MFLQDLFDEASTVTLASHTPDIGGAWTGRADTSGGSVNSADVVGGAGTCITVGGRLLATNAATPPSADYYVEVRGDRQSIHAWFGVVGRYVVGGTMYSAELDRDYSGQIRLFRWNAFTRTQIGATNISMANGVYTVRLQFAGTTIKVFVNGTERISFDDGANALLAAGVAGMFWQSMHLLDIVAVNAAPPVFTVQPSNQSVAEGSSATFNATVTGADSYQWQVSTNGGSSWANVSTGTGGTTSSYTTPATTSGMSGYQYRLQATNAFGTTTSSVATLTVNTPPALTDPTVASVTATGAQVGVSVAVTGGSLRRLTTAGLSVPSASTIKSTGTESTPSATGAQGPFSASGLTAGLTYRTHWVYTVSGVDSAVVSSAPFYPGTWRTTADVTVTGWTASAGSDLFALIDEDSASEADFITATDISTAQEAHFTLSRAAPAGDYIWRVRAAVSSGTGTLRVTMRDGSGNSVGASSDQAITTTPTTYDIPVTATGEAVRVSFRLLAD